MFKSAVYWIILSGVMMMTNTVMAGDASSESTRPPQKYQLEDVRISVLHQTSHRLPGSYKINISGDGKASYVIDNKDVLEITLGDKMLVELLNEFYRIHFFELPDTYTSKKRVALMDDHSIATLSNRNVDMSSQRLCIGIAEYEKCVTIMDEQPVEASQLVEKIESLFSERDTGL